MGGLHYALLGAPWGAAGRVVRCMLHERHGEPWVRYLVRFGEVLIAKLCDSATQAGARRQAEFGRDERRQQPSQKLPGKMQPCVNAAC